MQLLRHYQRAEKFPLGSKLKRTNLHISKKHLIKAKKSKMVSSPVKNQLESTWSLPDKRKAVLTDCKDNFRNSRNESISTLMTWTMWQTCAGKQRLI